MNKIAPSKIAASCSVVVLALCLAVGQGLAKPAGGGHPGGGGGHPGGGGGHVGGGAHFGGGGGHVGGAVSHFSVGHASHFSVGHAVTHFRAVTHASHFSTHASHFSAGRTSHVGSHATSHVGSRLTAHSLTGSHATTLAHHAAGAAGPASFSAHRHFAGDPAFRSFSGRGWHPYHHLGWIGPLFWPYAYGDLFYCSLWPGYYCGYDPFWAYGYGDIYESMFWPYDYGEYVQGPGAPQRMTSLTQGMTQSCSDEAAEVTGWPINQIQDAVQPNPQQNALLDNLGNAIVRASDEIKSHCPATVAFTPTDRLAQMKERLQALADAVNIVSPPLTKFYDSLSDEQKARFNDIAPPASQNEQAAQGGGPSVSAQCNANVMAWPTDRIDQLVKPDGAQRAKLSALQSASTQAADLIKAACPSEMPATPPARLAAIGKRLQAMLQGVQEVQPALADFYDSLSDNQKARFNTMGKQLFAANQE
jgi:LTXXQ motif family protein